MLTYNELKILEKEVNRLKERGEILDPRNSFERRELHAIIRQLKAIAHKEPIRPPIQTAPAPKPQRKLRLVKNEEVLNETK